MKKTKLALLSMAALLSATIIIQSCKKNEKIEVNAKSSELIKNSAIKSNVNVNSVTDDPICNPTFYYMTDDLKTSSIVKSEYAPEEFWYRVTNDQPFDAGWWDGYQDGVYYWTLHQNELALTYVPTGEWAFVLKFQNNASGAISYVSPYAASDPNFLSGNTYLDKGLRLVNVGTAPSPIQIKNATSQDGNVQCLKNQYRIWAQTDFGQSAERKRYDNGRYNGFLRGISQEPFSIQ